jgi:uncharacterized protein
MYNRLISLPENKSFFLFGQRGTGKTTLLKNTYGDRALEISLLDSKTLLGLTTAPWKIRELIQGKKKEQEIIIIDEIQKLPVLLNEVHKMIEEDNLIFALTGSSARKLKREGVNLLAGRAYEYRLFALSCFETKDDFDLDTCLQWGSLPRVVSENNNEDREEYLYSYVSTYLKEEIILEQIVRNIEPFSRFLNIAAQSNGDLINFSNIARDTGISDVSIRNYYAILEDTLIGFFLKPYHTSIRKRQKLAPKFYFFDIGLVRTLTNELHIKPAEKSFEYGMLFETFFINECIRLNEYLRCRFQFSFIKVNDKDEIDLIIEKPGGGLLLLEIKSKNSVSEKDVRVLNNLIPDFKNACAYCISRDPERKKIGSTLCLPWHDALTEIFGLTPDERR